MRRIKTIVVVIALIIFNSGCRALDIASKAIDEFDKAAKTETYSDEVRATENLVQEVVKLTQDFKSTVLTKEQLFNKLNAKESGLFIVNEEMKLEDFEPYFSETYTIAFATSLNKTVVSVIKRTANKNIIQLNISDLIKSK